METIRDQILGKPSEEIKECQKPKPILLHTGEVMHFDYHGEISILLFLNLWFVIYDLYLSVDMGGLSLIFPYQTFNIKMTDARNQNPRNKWYDYYIFSLRIYDKHLKQNSGKRRIRIIFVLFRIHLCRLGQEFIQNSLQRKTSQVV